MGRGRAWRRCTSAGFTITTNPTIKYFARWDGSQWSAVGQGPNSTVEDMAVFDDDGPGPNRPALFCVGPFNHVGWTPASHIAKWDGQQWFPLGSGLTDFPGGADGVTVSVFDEDGPGPNPGGLYAGGFRRGGPGRRGDRSGGCRGSPRPRRLARFSRSTGTTGGRTARS